MIENVYPLSHLQEGFYYHWLTAPDSPAYFLQMSYRLKGNLDIELLQESYAMLVERHPVLRTFFTQDFGEQVLQVVRKEADPAFLYNDFTGRTEADVEEYKQADRSRGFNLHTGSQMRLSLLALGNDTYEFIWSHHHIIMDGWCVGILMKEFMFIYSSLLQGLEPELEKAYPYASYIEWLTGADKEASAQYWKNYLAGFDTMSSLPQLPASGTEEYVGRETSFQLDASVSRAIRELCRQTDVTENSFFQAIWGILLARYNNTGDVLFGSIVSGRPAEVKGIEQMIGLFINTIPVRIRLNEDDSLLDLLKQVQQSSIESLDHHYTQLADIQAESESGQNLFDHIIQYQNFPVQEIVGGNSGGGEGASDAKELALVSSGLSGHNTFDFTCIISPLEALDFNFMYNASRYDDALISRLQSHLVRLVEGLVADPSAPIRRVDIISPEERTLLTETFNQTAAPELQGKTLLHLFEEQAAKNPGSTAVVFEGRELSYGDLDKKANSLANYLSSIYELRPGDLAGVMLERSEHLVIALLAIFKAGAVYVPIDPAYPTQRKEYVLADSGVKVLLTRTDYIFDLTYYSGGSFAMDAQLDFIDASTEAPSSRPQASDLAYVIYTSGSTGQPKGVMVQHGAVANTIRSHSLLFDMKEGDRSLQFASPSFDASLTQILVPLVSGGVLHIVGEEAKKDPVKLEQYITDHRINYADIPPAYQKLMNFDNITALEKLGSGGEAAIPEKVSQFTTHGTYYNAYGPTEAAICATMFVARPGNEAGRNVPIGKPIHNVQVYILDKYNHLLPAGQAGEICIGGAGLAAGYLNNGGLTEEKFLADPFHPGGRIYRTGDLGRWLPDGNIEFVGRKDGQVKIRGYRIELGEIESALQEHPGVSSAIVTARPNAAGENELVAYVVHNRDLNIPYLAEFLAARLPEYMLPTHYVPLEQLPLTQNGKIDRKNLPDPGMAAVSAAAEYVAPRNETEEKLVTIWEEVLGREGIGIKDDFFKLGGHSIKVVQLISRINSTFLVRIDIQSIFNDPTIENISEQIIFIQEQNRQKESAGNLVQIEL